MRTTVRRLGAALLSTLIAGAVTAGPAHAQSRPESFLGQATASALDLNLLGQQLTLGQSFALGQIGTKLEASAKGAGQLLAPLTTSLAEAATENQTVTDANKCGPLSLPDALKPLLSLATACSSSASTIKAGVPQAAAKANVATVGVGLQPVGQVLAPVQNLVESVLGPVQQLAPQLDPVTTTVSGLLDTIAKGQVLAVSLGDTASSVVSTPKTVNSLATAAGASIDLLPLGGKDGGSLLSIKVGAAKATAVYDRATGQATPTFDPALVRVHIAPLPLLNNVAQDIAVAPGQSITLLQGTPLESTISVGAGSTKTDSATGAIVAVADGVSVQLLKGLNGGIKLALAHAEAGTKGLTAIAAPVNVPRAVAELPRTGGPGPWLPIAGATLVAAAFITRRFLVSAR